MGDTISEAVNTAFIYHHYHCLASEVTRFLMDYTDSVKSAPSDAHRLYQEITAFSFVLEQMRRLLLQGKLEASFGDTCVLYSVVKFSETHIGDLYKKLCKVGASNSNKLSDLVERIKWLLQKEECEKTVASLNRLSQYFQFSLGVSNRLVR